MHAVNADIHLLSEFGNYRQFLGRVGGQKRTTSVTSFFESPVITLQRYNCI